MDDEGEKQVLVVDIVQREHGAAVEQELGGKRLEAEDFPGDAQRRLRAAGEGGEGHEKKKQPSAARRRRCGVGMGTLGTGMALGAYPSHNESA